MSTTPIIAIGRSLNFTDGFYVYATVGSEEFDGCDFHEFPAAREWADFWAAEMGWSDYIVTADV